MPESPEIEARVSKIQKDVEQLKEFMKDSFHDRRDHYEKRVRKVLEKHLICIILWLEIDGIRSFKEVEDDIKLEGRNIPHVSLWRAKERLLRAGLIKKIGMKRRSPVFTKKPWAKELNIDDFVRKAFLEEE